MKYDQIPKIPVRHVVTIPCRKLPPEQCATELSYRKFERQIILNAEKNRKMFCAVDLPSDIVFE